MSPEILSCVIHREIKLENAKQCRNQHVLVVSNNKFCVIDRRFRSNAIIGAYLNLLKMFRYLFECYSVIHWKTQNILVRSSYFENCLNAICEENLSLTARLKLPFFEPRPLGWILVLVHTRFSAIRVCRNFVYGYYLSLLPSATLVT